MYDNFKESRSTSRISEGLLQVKINSILKNTYLWMMVGLVLTSGASYLLLNMRNVFPFLNYVFSPVVFFAIFIAQIALVFFLSLGINSMKAETAMLSFVIYSILNGITLTPIFLIYTNESITFVFLITALMFGVTSVFAIVTKTDLTKLGSFLTMGVIGLVIASLFNMFFKSSPMYMLISYAGVLIFTGLTAYDTQRIKNMALEIGETGEDITNKMAIIGALTLYLDFINIFIYLLRIFGKRRD